MPNRISMTSSPIGRSLFSMMLANLAGSFFIMSFGLVDMLFISMLGDDALTASGFFYPVSLLVSSLAIGLGVALSIRFGHYLGKNDKHKASAMLFDALLLTFAIIGSCSLLLRIGAPLLFDLLGASEPTRVLIGEFLDVWTLASPMLALLMVCNQALRSAGLNKIAATGMLIAGALNALFDPIFMFGFGPIEAFGIQGAAIASALAWFITLSITLIRIIGRYHLLHWHRLCTVRIAKHWQSLIFIAKSASISSLLNPLFNTLLLAILAAYSHDAVAAFGVGVRIESLLLIVTFSLSSALTAFLAQNLAAELHQRAYQAAFTAMHWIIAWQLLLYLILCFSHQAIADIFSDDAEVIFYISLYLLLLPLGYAPLGVIIVIANALNAYEKPALSLLINGIRLFAVMLPMSLLAGSLGGVGYILASVPLANFVVGVVCYTLAKKWFHRAD